MDSFNEVWNNVCEFCKSEMTQVAYNSWTATLSPVGMSDGKSDSQRKKQLSAQYCHRKLYRPA